VNADVSAKRRKQTIAIERAVVHVFVAFLIGAFAIPTAAQDSPEQTAALLQRLFVSEDFTVKTFGPARWVERVTLISSASSMTWRLVRM